MEMPKLQKLLIWVCILLPAIAFTQEDSSKVKEIRLHSAKTLEGLGDSLQILTGSVHMEHEGTHMYCDSANLYSKVNRLDAFGNVKIKSDSGATLYGDSLFYNGQTKLAIVRGNIRMVDKDYELTTRFLDYYSDTKMAQYYSGGTLVNKKEKSTLISEKGYYYSKQKEFFFKDSVFLDHPDYKIYSDTLMHNTSSEVTYFYGPTDIFTKDDSIYSEWGWYSPKEKVSSLKKNAVIRNKNQTMKGDSIYYNDSLDIGEAFGHVYVQDTSEKMEVYGEYMLHNEKDSSSLVTGDSVLFIQYEKKDTLYLHADTILVVTDTSTHKRIVYAYYKAKFYRHDMQGACDSLVYSDADSTLELFDNPMIWSEDNQLVADSMIIYLEKGEPKEMHLTRRSFIASKIDSVHFNQISGHRMKGIFKDGDLHLVRVLRNGKSIYYPVEEKRDTTQRDSTGKSKIKQKIIGMNTANGEDMNIHLKDSKVHRIVIYKPTEGSNLTPMSQTTGKSKLEGFSWHQNHRPKSKVDVFSWPETQEQ